MKTSDDELLRMIYEMKVDIGEIKVDLHHHIQGTVQNRESLKLMQQQAQIQRDLMEKRFDQIERHNSDRLAVERGQARVFKWASIGLGIIISSYAVGNIFLGLGGLF